MRNEKSKLSLHKSKIPKLSDSSRKFIPKKERKSMNDPFLEKIARTRINKMKKFQAYWLKPRVKILRGQKAMLEVKIHRDAALDKNGAGRGMKGSGNRRLASESNPVEQSQDFATSTGTLDREEMSELSDISPENVVTTRSPTDTTMMHRVTEKTATSSSFSERVNITLGNFFPLTFGTGTGDEVETQEEEEDDDEQDDFESQLSLHSSTHETGKLDLRTDLAWSGY